MMATLARTWNLLVFEACSLLARRTPTDRGRWRLARRAMSAATHLGDRGGERRMRTRHGFRMTLNLNDWLGRRLYAVGEYEAATTHVLASLSEPGATVVDVGANAGYFTLLASQHVREFGHVHAFEPVQINRLRLVENVQLNRATNVTIHREAASSREGIATFFEGPANHRGLSTLRPMSESSRSQQVPTVRLDDVLPTDRRISLVKIDVEGAEQHVLAGMLGIIRRDAPDIVLEVTDDFLQSMGHSALSLVNLLLKQGYRAFSIEYECLTPLDVNTIPGRQFNALFTQRETLPASLSSRIRHTDPMVVSQPLRQAA